MTESCLATAVNPASVEIRVAQGEEAPTLENMLSLYLHDLSPFTGATIGRNGRYAYPYLDRYWTTEGAAEGRVPFLITVDGELGGFTLKGGRSRLDQPAPVNEVSEFFVVRKWRGQGMGRIAAQALFDRFPGTWEVAQLRANVRARTFWLGVIGDYTDHQYSEHDLDTGRWNGFVQVFQSLAGTPA